MKFDRNFLFFSILGILVEVAGQSAEAQTAPPVVVSAPVAVPPPAANGPLSPSYLVWDSDLKSIDTHEGEMQGHLSFSFTNVSSGNVVINDVHPGCGCTTTELPPRPWTIPAGTSGVIPVTINIHQKTGTLFKTLSVSTDKGIKTLNFKVNILPVVLPQMSAAERTNNMLAALSDRQAVFKGDCITCHVTQGQGKYGKDLYDADCAICHEGEHRATMVPDLHNLKVPTTVEFWRTWIAHGKATSLMPAFSNGDGGPLSDLQIAGLATWLNFSFPSKVTAPQ